LLVKVAGQLIFVFLKCRESVSDGAK